MPGSTQTVRRVQTSKVADFDDQLWPINCAILILAGFVTGIVIATSKFDEPRLLYNGWVRLLSVGLMVGLLFWGVMWLQGKMLRRLQLCLLLSLLGHLGLAVYLHERYLALVAEWQAKSPDQVVEQYRQITLPDYSWQQIEQPHTQQSFEEPIQTEVPRPTDPESVQRAAKEPDVLTETPPPDEPEVPQRQQPNPAIARRAELSAPRRADAAAGAQVSRQRWKDRPSPNQPNPEPEIIPQPRQVAAAADSTFAPRTQADVRLRVDQQQTPEQTVAEPATQIEIRPQRLAARPEPTPDRQSSPAPARQTAPRAQIPRADAAAPQRVEVASQPPRETPRSPRTAAARQQADAPRVIRPAADPTAAAALPERPGPSQLARATTRRVEDPMQPSPSPRADGPARLTQPEDGRLAARARIESTAVGAPIASSQRTDPPVADPSTAAVSREADSPLHAMRDAPALHPLPPMSSNAELPSAVAARRSAASQRQPVGAEAVPATPSTLARFAGGVDLPSTAIALESQPATTPAAAGGNPASRLRVVPDAAVLRSAGRPPLGKTTAAAPAADFAVGSAEAVARTGRPRSTGLWQPSATANASAPRIARAAGPPAQTAASGIAEAAPTLAGPVASPPSEPSVASFNAQDSATRRGGTVRPFAARADIGAGPAGSSGTPGPVGVAQSSRVTRHESIASAVAGGGTPRPGRTAGGAVAPNAVAEASLPSAGYSDATPNEQTAAGGGTTSRAAPWPAQLSGPRRQVSGLPGALQRQPVAGALASLDSQGAPSASAAARRAVAPSQQQGGSDAGSMRSSTLSRASTGTDLPAPAVAVDDVSKAGAGGLAVTQGGLLSSLPAGPNAAVRQAAAALPVGQTMAAARATESGLGSAEVVGLAGRTRAVADDAPASGASAPARRTGRTVATGQTLAVSAAPPTESVGGVPAGGAAAEVDDPRRMTAGALRAAVARGSGRLPAVGPADLTDAGASPGDTTVAAAPQGGASPDGAGTAAGRRRVAEEAGPEETLAGLVGRGPQRTTAAPGLLPATGETIDVSPIVPTAGASAGGPVDLSGATAGEASRPAGGLPVRIATAEGPGGLGYLPSPEVGIPSRRARPESEIIHTIFRRFVIERSGGQAAIDGRVRQDPTEAFRQRDPGRRAEVAQAWGGSEGTEAAVEMGLDYFARNQFPDGHWSLHELPEAVEYEDAALGEMEADSAATGLALLSYLGAGYTHLDGKFRGEVGRGIDWLVRHQKADGELFTGGTKYTRFYSHGIAAIALCEAYGMTRDPQLRGPASKAIEFIVNTQHSTRGGWRYDLQPETGRATETDTSVSGWMLMALKSAQMAGLEVPPGVLDKINAWLDTARAAGADGQYVYNPHALDTAEQRAGRRPNLAMTSEAMLMRMYLGRQRNDPGLIVGADHLKDNLPEVGTRAEPLRDCYYWYYATQAMFQMQDDYWTAWNGRLRPLATSSQVKSGELAGSWHPLRPIEDRWGRAAGRHYVTALHLLMLEVYYRHLPLFKELGK